MVLCLVVHPDDAGMVLKAATPAATASRLRAEVVFMQRVEAQRAFRVHLAEFAIHAIVSRDVADRTVAVIDHGTVVGS